MGLKEFQVGSRLGEGSFSSVWKVKRISDGQEYAMKKVKMASLSEKEKQNALNEVRILASIKNPYIIGYKEAFFEDNSMTLCIVMEYAGGGDLYNKIVQHQKSRTYFKEEDIWTYAIQMIVGLKTLHDMKILHRDLKCANVFLSKDGKEAKLGDLNVSKVAKTNLVYTQTGTPYYASPEVWRDQPYDSKSDIWSLGCVLYELCALKPPFRANDMSGLNKKIQKGVFDRIPSQYSSELNNFIAMCLQVSPSLRPSCDKLLTHPTLIKHGQDFMKNLDRIFEQNELLGTIKLPRNIRALADNLPKPNYEIARSEEFEKGILNNSEESEREVPVRRMPRAYSQQGRKVVDDKVVLKPPYRQYRVPSAQHRIAPKVDNLESRHQIRIVQRGGIERPRPVKNPSPSSGENDENSRIYNSNVVPVRKVVDPLEGYAIRKRSANLSENRPVYNVRVMKQNQENIDQNIIPNMRYERPKVNVREKLVLPSPKMISEQEYLVNKYLNIDNGQGNNYNYNPSPNPRNLDRVYSDKGDLLSRRADNIVRKYYADAVLAGKREPLSELRMANGTPMNYGKDALDILDRYSNAYNAREQPVRIPSSRRQHQVVDLAENQNSAGNNINFQRQQQIQLRGVVKPSWWG